MPGPDGRATAAVLRRLEPGLRFAFMTGDPTRINVGDLLAAGAATVLLKPFDLQEVLDALVAMRDAA